MNACVVGLGWMGLPIALTLANVGHKVTGYDVSAPLVHSLNDGRTAQPDLAPMLKQALAKRLFQATNDAKAINNADAVCVIVPLLIKEDKSPDYSVLEAATKAIAANMKDNALIVINTTMPIGGTRAKIKPILDKAKKKYSLAYSPIRAMSGTALQDMTENYPRILGALDGESAKRAKELLSSFTKNEIITMPSLEDAEAVKLFEVTYRDTNIALANELALVCEDKGLDYKRIQEAANSCRHYHLHDAGIGVGGHCLPVYPHLLLSITKADKGLIRKAREVNDFMPLHAAGVVLKSKPKTVGVLGVAYRPETSEHRWSPAIALCEKLKAKARVLVNDPYVSQKELAEYGKPSSLDEVLKCDAVVLVTAHHAYRGLEPKFTAKQLVVDGRAFFDKSKIKADYYRIGSKRE